MWHVERAARYADPVGQYVALNLFANALREDLDCPDMWVLQAFLQLVYEEFLASPHDLERQSEPDAEELETGSVELRLQPRVHVTAGGGSRFEAERHLHDYLYHHWDETELGKDWAIYEGSVGYEFTTGVGRIDLLARHRNRAGWSSS